MTTYPNQENTDPDEPQPATTKRAPHAYKPVNAGGDPNQTPDNDGNNPDPDEDARDEDEAPEYNPEDEKEKGDSNNTNVGL